MARQWLSQSNVWAVVGPELLPLLVLFPWRTQTDTVAHIDEKNEPKFTQVEIGRVRIEI